MIRNVNCQLFTNLQISSRGFKLEALNPWTWLCNLLLSGSACHSRVGLWSVQSSPMNTSSTTFLQRWYWFDAESCMQVTSLVNYFLNYTLGLHSSTVFNTPLWTSSHDSRVCNLSYNSAGEKHGMYRNWIFIQKSHDLGSKNNVATAHWVVWYLPANQLQC